jgi:hypothetical protein
MRCDTRNLSPQNIQASVIGLSVLKQTDAKVPLDVQKLLSPRRFPAAVIMATQTASLVVGTRALLYVMLW